MAQTQAQKKAATKSRAKQKARGAGAGSAKKLAALSEQNGQLQTAMLNIRQMYDQSIMEKQATQTALNERDQLITAFLITLGGSFTVPKASIQAVMNGEYTGYGIAEDDEEGFVLTAEEVQADGDEGDE